MKTEKDVIKCESIYSDDREHRFVWKRIWNKDKPMAAVIMLNPCHADNYTVDTSTALVVNNITEMLLSQYNYLRKSPMAPEFKTFIQQFINKITVGNYTVYIYLKTGLDIVPALDKEFSIRREDLYSWGLDKKRNGFRL